MNIYNYNICTCTSNITQSKLSQKRDNHLFSSLLEASSIVNKAHLLSVSSPHADSWFSVPPLTHHSSVWPSNGSSVWTHLVAPSVHKKSLDPLGHQATTCKHEGGIVFHHYRLQNIVAEICHRAQLSIHLEVGQNLSPNHCNTHPANMVYGQACGLGPIRHIST